MNWIIQNKEWLFSGLLVSVPLALAGWWRSKASKKKVQKQKGGDYFYTKDHLGSVREMTTEDGTIEARYDYDPYGRMTKIINNKESDFAYAGYYNHQTSCLFLTLFREYNASVGRWISRDPMGEGGGVNLYDYVLNSPINSYDPFGLIDCADLRNQIDRMRGDLQRGSDALDKMLSNQNQNNTDLYWVDRAADAAFALTGNAAGKGVNAARTALTSEAIGQGGSLGVDLARGGSFTGPGVGGGTDYATSLGGSVAGPLVSKAAGTGLNAIAKKAARNWTTDGVRQSMNDTVNGANESLNCIAGKLRNASSEYRKNCQ